MGFVLRVSKLMGYLVLGMFVYTAFSVYTEGSSTAQPAPAPGIRVIASPSPQQVVDEPEESLQEMQTLSKVKQFLEAPVGAGDWRERGQILGKELVALPESPGKNEAYIRWQESPVVKEGVRQTKVSLVAVDKAISSAAIPMQKAARTKIKDLFNQIARDQQIEIAATQKELDGKHLLIITAPVMTEEAASIFIEGTDILKTAGEAGYSYIYFVSDSENLGWRWKTTVNEDTISKSDSELEAEARAMWSLDFYGGTR